MYYTKFVLVGDHVCELLEQEKEYITSLSNYSNSTITDHAEIMILINKNILFLYLCNFIGGLLVVWIVLCSKF